ncbi:MAG: hypothetical protein ACREYE_18960 [Gammaproteobacteria bacterium]
MDTVILVASVAAIFTVAYAVVWTVRAVRRVGMHQFGRALGALVWAVLVACFKLFRPDPTAWRRKQPDPGGVPIDVIESQENSSRTNPGANIGLCFNYRTGQFDEGADPVGIYDSEHLPHY